MKNIMGRYKFVKKYWPTWIADEEDHSIEIV